MLKKIILPCCLLSTVIASNAWASDEGFYLGLGVAYADIDLDNVTKDSVTYEPDGNSTAGGSFTLGYNSSPNFAFEFGGIIFNSLSYDDSDGDNAPDHTTSVGYFDIKPAYAYQNFNAFLRLGTAYVYAQDSYSGDDDETLTHAFEPLFGAGLGYNFSPAIEIDLSANRIQDSNAPITYGQLEISFHSVQHYTPGGFLVDD